ncbi:MAG: glycosyltransferase family 4 protein [Pelobium sp.]
MEADYNLCIIEPNKGAFSETFIREHNVRLAGKKRILYGGSFPLFDHDGNYLIKSKLGLLSYLIQKRIFKKKQIKIRSKALANYLVKENIEVVFAEYGMVGAMVTRVCKSLNIPLIVHFHGADIYHQETIAKYKDLYQELFSDADAIIAVSADMVQELIKKGAPANKIHQLSCGVDVNAFPKIDITQSERNFISIGRFVEKKSPQSIVKAFKLVIEKFPDAKLWMVGDGPLHQETKLLVEELGLSSPIILTGILDSENIRLLIKKSRCFVQHSVTAKSGDKEGTPVTVLEAGSSGLAIVSTQHGGIQEAVINQETGYLVAEHDIEGMAAYMIKIAENVTLASELGNKEAQHIRLNFNIEDRIKALNKIIKKAVSKN